MKYKAYKCDHCNRSFGRKWNALRHSKLKHTNLAQISKDNIKIDRFSYKTHNKYYDYQTKFKILGDIETQLETIEPGIYFSDYFSANPVDLKIIKIIDQLIEPIEELEKILGRINERTKAFILLQSLFASLQTNEPVKSLIETVELYHSMKVTKKIVRYMSKLDVESSEEPMLLLKRKIKNSYIFRGHNN